MKILSYIMVAPIILVANCGPVEYTNENISDIQASDNYSSRKTVILPDQNIVLPTKIIRTSEKKTISEVVDYHTTHHVWQSPAN